MKEGVRERSDADRGGGGRTRSEEDVAVEAVPIAVYDPTTDTNKRVGEKGPLSTLRWRRDWARMKIHNLRRVTEPWMAATWYTLKVEGLVSLQK
jgi:hypothetical protein